MTNPEVTTFFDKVTESACHIAVHPAARTCAIIDPILGFDDSTGKIDTVMADKCVDFVETNKLKVEWLLETHIHADHLSAAHYLQKILQGKTGIGANVTQLQKHYSSMFHASALFRCDGSQFDHLFTDAERFTLGLIRCIAIPTPGYSPEGMTYFVGDAAFVGKTVMMPDIGTARTDLPGGDAHTLYQSIQRLFEFPPETRIFLGSDHKTSQRSSYQWETTIEEQCLANRQISEGMTEERFVTLRQEEDKKLKIPDLMLSSLQVNIRAGHLPPVESDGNRYLKIPVSNY